MKNLKPGDDVPYFILRDQHGDNFSIRDHIGKKKMVIYFYPKDESAVCTAEACAFKDSFTEFTEAGALVIGINSGTVKSHESFSRQNNLPFSLLSDTDNTVLKRFGVKPWLFLTGRETFVVDLDGKISFTFRAFLNGWEHPRQVLEFLKRDR
jgi:peroxiredoxin Q/BCP